MSGILIKVDVYKVIMFITRVIYPMQLRLRIILHEVQLIQKYNHDL
jgi:hypothetical protein